MKKEIMLIIIILFTILPTISIKYGLRNTAEKNIGMEGAVTMKEMWEAYATIVENYFKAQDDYKKTGILSEKDYNTLYFAPDGTLMEQKSKQKFLVYDLNADGVPELFIGRYYSDENNYVIYDAYTWVNNEATRFLPNKDIGYRNGSCDIRENGIILSFFSGSAWDYGFEVLQLPESGSTVNRIESFRAVRSGEAGQEYSEYYKHKEGDISSIKITEEEYLQYRDHFKILDLSYLDTGTETIDLLRNGEIEY